MFTVDFKRTHPDLSESANGVAQVSEFSGDGSVTETRGHREVGDSSSGQDDRPELVEQSLSSRDGEVPRNDDQVGEEHDGEDCPELWYMSTE